MPLAFAGAAAVAGWLVDPAGVELELADPAAGAVVAGAPAGAALPHAEISIAAPPSASQRKTERRPTVRCCSSNSFLHRRWVSI